MDNRFEQANLLGIGQDNIGYARYFSGASFLNPLTDPEMSGVSRFQRKHIET